MIEFGIIVGALTCLNLNLYLIYLSRLKRCELERIKKERKLTSDDADPFDLLAAANPGEKKSLWQ